MIPGLLGEPLWTDQTKEESHHTKRKHGGGSVVVWGWFAAGGAGRPAEVNRTMNSAVDPQTQKVHMCSALNEDPHF